MQRHNEAVNAANWTRPFPFDATKRFFGVVEDNTPRFFEREVGEGLRQVEAAVAPAPIAALEGHRGSIEPPPLPPGTPDAERSHERQMATAANALHGAFLKGESLPLRKDEWQETAKTLADAVKPILDFLRESEAPKG